MPTTNLQPVWLLGLWLLLGLSGCSWWDADFPEQLPVQRFYSATGELRAGAGVATIELPEVVDLAGFSASRDSTGTLDALTVRALVIERGELRVALVECDLIGLQRFHVEKWKSRLEGFEPERVIIACTHTHSGPDTLGLWGTPPFSSGLDDEVLESVEAALQQALSLATSDLRPARFSSRQARLPRLDGLSRNIRRPGLVDPRLPVASFQTSEGDTIATLVGFGMHPESLWSHNTAISADYPRWLRQEVEEELGGVALFVAGALGAMVTPDREEALSRPEDAARIGTALGSLAAREASTPAPFSTDPPLELLRAEIAIPLDNCGYRLARFFGLFEREVYDGYVLSGVSLLRVGSLTVACVPGELAPELGLALKAQLPGEISLICGLADDELGYLLPQHEYALPLYDYERTVCPGPLGGAIVVDDLLMLGRLSEAWRAGPDER